MRLNRKISFILAGAVIVTGLCIGVFVHRQSRHYANRDMPKNPKMIAMQPAGPDPKFKTPENFKMPKLTVSQEQAQISAKHDFSKYEVHQGKVHFNLAMLMGKSREFRDANHDLSLEQVASGGVSFEKIILPEGLKLKYQNAENCRTAASQKPQQSGAGTMAATVALTSQSTLRGFIDSVASDSCISKVTFE